MPSKTKLYSAFGFILNKIPHTYTNTIVNNINNQDLARTMYQLKESK